jgi:hypothetical protein
LPDEQRQQPVEEGRRKERNGSDKIDGFHSCMSERKDQCSLRRYLIVPATHLCAYIKHSDEESDDFPPATGIYREKADYEDRERLSRLSLLVIQRKDLKVLP